MTHEEFASSVATEIDQLIDQHARLFASIPAAVILAAVGSDRHARAVASGRCDPEQPFIAAIRRDVDLARYGRAGEQIQWVLDKDPDAVAYVITVGAKAPTRKHQSHQSALKEAHRLSRKHPGVEFAVVEIKKVIVHQPTDQFEQTQYGVLVDPANPPAPNSPLGKFIRQQNQ